MKKLLLSLGMLLVTFLHAGADSQKKYEYTFYIGRFQPVHNGHIRVMEEALNISDKLIVLCGSADKSGTEKNPLTFMERANLIRKVMDKKFPGRVMITSINDYPFDKQWEDAVHKAVSTLTSGSKSIALVGHFKDDSSYYLNNFPEFELVKMPNYDNINATDIRKNIREKNLDAVKAVIPSIIYEDVIKLIK
ncbi:MAG: adenylyltransferase/cytidyltransferase family protein [Alphaproteobacteria bacterium]|nr:adenylyltransferase/cytidyltransferase family protein [Alphaproteobacteria bacterium]OJV13187.1 MAG: hypothetical protein BGO27_00080 [Alphaproteobacteria bacterium 33-17]